MNISASFPQPFFYSNLHINKLLGFFLFFFFLLKIYFFVLARISKSESSVIGSVPKTLSLIEGMFGLSSLVTFAFSLPASLTTF